MSAGDMIENTMVDDGLWKEDRKRPCKFCKKIECICEDESE